jgi:hypothetical protein
VKPEVAMSEELNEPGDGTLSDTELALNEDGLRLASRDLADPRFKIRSIWRERPTNSSTGTGWPG